MSSVHLVVPDTVDDPERPSGGNTYDRRVGCGLTRLGWAVHEHRAAGDWPEADGPSRTALGVTLAGIPGKAVVLLDGLVACASPEVLVPQASRLRLVVLVHLPLGERAMPPGGAEQRSRERAVLDAAAGVVTTSRWTREWLVTTYGLVPGRVRVVPPGVDPAEEVPGSPTGGRLVAVGAVTRTKGTDLLVDALADVSDLPWSCTCVGSLAVDPAFAARARHRAQACGLDGRLRFTGPRTGTELDAVYAAADLVMAPSRTETFGMVVTEALARATPVVGADVGGLPEALGRAADGRRPGILVTPDDRVELAAALRRWLTDAGLRESLRRAARDRRCALDDWSVTAEGLAGFLTEVAA